MDDTENYDATPLSEDAIAAHREAIAHLCEQLLDCDDMRAWGGLQRALQRELRRERAHLQAELAAGRYLPLPEDDGQ